MFSQVRLVQDKLGQDLFIRTHVHSARHAHGDERWTQGIENSTFQIYRPPHPTVNFIERLVFPSKFETRVARLFRPVTAFSHKE